MVFLYILLLWLFLTIQRQHRRLERLEMQPRHHGSIEWFKNNLPVIVQPQFDVDNGNGLIAVYVTANANQIHLTIVYKGESSYSRWKKSQLNRAGSLAYRTHNYVRYGRTVDATYLTYTQNEDGTWLNITTPDYCGNQSWNKGNRANFMQYSLFKHYLANLSRNVWNMFPGTSRPMLYVNTCNHLHGPVNLNSEYPMHVWVTYPVYMGDTEMANHFVKNVRVRKSNRREYIDYPQPQLTIWNN